MNIIILIQTENSPTTELQNECLYIPGVFNLFSPIPLFLVCQLCISHHHGRSFLWDKDIVN